MPHRMRVFGVQDPDIPIDDLMDALKRSGLSATFELDPNEQPNRWTMFDLLNIQGEPLAQIERNPVIEGELGQKELSEFREVIQSCKPRSAAQWLKKYLDEVHVIYSFRLLHATAMTKTSILSMLLRPKLVSKREGFCK